jgi:hypothetical protein
MVEYYKIFKNTIHWNKNFKINELLDHGDWIWPDALHQDQEPVKSTKRL